MIQYPFVMLLVATAACAYSPGSSRGATAGASSQTADSLRGKVTIVGSDPGTWLSLQPENGGASLRLEGAAGEPLRSVGGSMVTVTGHRNGAVFEVASFIVREVDGQPANDGVVTRQGTSLALMLTGGGRFELSSPVEHLYRIEGLRIWMIVPRPGSAPSYGVITAGRDPAARD